MSRKVYQSQELKELKAAEKAVTILGILSIPVITLIIGLLVWGNIVVWDQIF